MKNITSLITFLFLSFIGLAQNPRNGLYVDTITGSFICIKGDSISYRYSNYYYYGTFCIDQNKIILNENLAMDRNVSVKITPCNKKYIEFTAYELYSNGEDIEDTMIHIRQSKFMKVILGNNGIVRFSEDGIVRLNNTNKNIDSIEKIFVASENVEFFTELSIPLSFGNRYTVTQKYKNCNPMIAWYLLFDNYRILYKSQTKSIEIKYKYAHKRKCINFIRVGDCESCIEELRKYYPDF